jgi:hypothetical protein
VTPTTIEVYTHFVIDRSSSHRGPPSTSYHTMLDSVRPNPSLERTSTGLALGPRTGSGHHPLRGPSANPVGSAQLKR